MKTLKESKVGDTVRVVRLHGEGCADSQGGTLGRSDGSDRPRL